MIASDEPNLLITRQMESSGFDEEKGYRRKVVNADNNIDVILAGRAKKHSVAIPCVDTLPGKRLRKLIMSEKDFTHLLGEVTGEKYENPCRPELEYLLLGFKANIASESVAILYDDAKCLFILSMKHEDLILCRTKDRSLDQFEILSSVSKVGKLEYNCLDPARQRLFRRFLREHIKPLMCDEAKVAEAVERIRSHFYQRQEGIESDSESSQESVKEAAVVLKKKPVKRVSKLVKGGAANRSTTLTREGSAKGGKLLGGESAAGTRRTISSFSKKT